MELPIWEGVCVCRDCRFGVRPVEGTRHTHTHVYYFFTIYSIVLTRSLFMSCASMLVARTPHIIPPPLPTGHHRHPPRVGHPCCDLPDMGAYRCLAYLI